MERAEIEDRLERAEAAVESGSGLARSGFCDVVAAVKRDQSLAEPYGRRIADIDRRDFESKVLATIPIRVGTAVMVAATLVGLALVWAAYGASDRWSGPILLAGTVVTLVSTHGLAHLAVGTLVGMRFTHWFSRSVTRPQPGVKVDYATYLSTPARSRAWMHASGALLTKAIPFFALGPALVIGVSDWVTAVLVVLGMGQIVADVIWSSKASDWKKFRREMDFAR